MSPKRPTPASRVKSLLTLDAGNVLRRLEARQATMVQAFSRHRDRQALLRPIRSRFDGAGFDELVQLTPRQQEAATRFYEILDDLAYYFTYTEDMPGTASEKLSAYLEDLQAAHRDLLASLGRRRRGGKTGAGPE
ncbi:MAG: hypothetical protein P1V51_06825 [Deltaproteobacteria bacterium]|nr:hypothetical protein [Deltaproteobacteria bacterium]